MGPRMRRVNWTITERQHQALKRLSRETGLPISELVRRALDQFLAAQAHPVPPADPAGEREREREQEQEKEEERVRA